MKSVRVVCAHDCPDMCSLIASVEDGKVVRVQGDPDHPYTAGFACGKVNRDADLVNSPERIATPLKRTGPKGAGKFKSITWDEALDEITSKWQAIIADSGPQAIGHFVGHVCVVLRIVGDERDPLVPELGHLEVVFAVDRPERLVLFVGESHHLGDDRHLLRADVRTQQLRVCAEIQRLRLLLRGLRG